MADDNEERRFVVPAYLNPEWAGATDQDWDEVPEDEKFAFSFLDKPMHKKWKRPFQLEARAFVKKALKTSSVKRIDPVVLSAAMYENADLFWRTLKRMSAEEQDEFYKHIQDGFHPRLTRADLRVE